MLIDLRVRGRSRAATRRILLVDAYNVIQQARAVIAIGSRAQGPDVAPPWQLERTMETLLNQIRGLHNAGEMERAIWARVGQ
ncbi:unnamed protein product, partial [Penicillium viridicatum]